MSISSASISPKTPSEKILYGFNLNKILGSGETISAATVSISVASGTDPDTAAMLEGSPIVDFAPIVRHLVRNGVSGNTYTLQVAVTTSRGQRLEPDLMFRVL